MQTISETIELISRQTTFRKLKKLNRVSAKYWLVYNNGPDTVDVLEHKLDSPVHGIKIEAGRVQVFHFNPIVHGKDSKVTISVRY